jgi:hypothetical protein
MQRDLAHFLDFGSRDFCAAEATGGDNLDSATVVAKATADCLAHRSAVRDSPLQLLRDTFSHELRIQFRLTDFVHVYVYLRVLINLANDPLLFLLQLVDTLSAATDDCAWPSRVKRDANTVRCALDVHAANVAHAKPSLDKSSNLMVAQKKMLVQLLVREPVAIRIADDAKSKPYWMYFLTQRLLLLSFFLGGLRRLFR